MKRLLAVLIGAAFCATAAGQSTAPATDATATQADKHKAKQEMVQGTTKAAASQYSSTPNRGTPPPSKKSNKMTKEERQEAMQGVNKQIGASQYGTSAGQQAAAAKKDAPKAEKPDMSDPKVREAMQKQKP